MQGDRFSLPSAGCRQIPSTSTVGVLARAGLIGLVLVAASCAHTGPARTVSPGGVIVVENGTAEPIEVFVDGSRTGVVSARKSIRMDRLGLGPREAQAIGELTGSRFEETFDLRDGEPSTWRVQPSAGQTEALGRMPMAGVGVRNRTSEPVRVFIDDTPHEMVWAGGEAQYGGLSMGVHTLRAEGVRTGFSRDAKVVVGSGVFPVFTVSSPQGGIRIVNQSGLRLRVVVGEASTRVVAAGEEWVVARLNAGSQRISASDMMNRAVWTGTVPVEDGVIAEVVLPSPKGALAVLSDLDAEVVIAADGHRLGRCPARGGAEFRGLPTGLAHVQAIDASGKVVARTRIDIPTDGQGSWMLKSGGGTSETAGDEGVLMVQNRLDEPVRLTVDDWERGELSPGARREVHALRSGEHTVQALGLRSRDVFRAQVTIAGGGHATWEVMPSLATLAVANERKEDIRVLVEGSEIGIVAALGKAEFKVASGRSKFETRGVDTYTGRLREIDLPAGTKTTVTESSPTATVVVTNSFSDPVSLSFGERELGVVLPGDRVAIPGLEPGAHLLLARSLKRPLSWNVSVTLRAGEEYPWEIGK